MTTPKTILGRRRIRAELPGSTKGRPNRETRLWDLTSDDPLIVGLRQHYLASLDLIDRRDQVKRDAVASGKFTLDGLRQHVMEHSIAATATTKRARNLLAKARDRAAELSKELVLPAPDEGRRAVATRQRFLQHLDSLPAGIERDRAAQNLAAKYPLAAEALTELPVEIAGVSPSVHQSLVDRALEQAHGEKIASLRQLEQAIDRLKARGGTTPTTAPHKSE